MRQIRVLLADDHRMFLAGLRKLLESEFEVVAAVEDGRALVQAAVKLSPDVIVADISMPSLNGIDAARQLREAGCAAKILFLTMHGDSLFVREALRAGAAGYILKRDAPDQLVLAIHQVSQGKTHVTAGLREGPEPGTTLGNITPRQREVLQLVAEGRSLKEIASALNVSTKTVEFHKSRLKHRLDVQNSAQLIAIAIRHGLVSVWLLWYQGFTW